MGYRVPAGRGNKVGAVRWFGMAAVCVRVGGGVRAMCMVVCGAWRVAHVRRRGRGVGVCAGAAVVVGRGNPGYRPSLRREMWSVPPNR